MRGLLVGGMDGAGRLVSIYVIAVTTLLQGSESLVSGVFWRISRAAVSFMIYTRICVTSDHAVGSRKQSWAEAT